MSQKNPRQSKEIDYVFSRYPLWIRYSGLPESIGVVAWAVYQRLLELRYRFESTTFFYPIEKLCKTTGLSGIGAMRRILRRLIDAKLIHYKTSRGRGQAAEFEIVEPINTPIPEEELYLTNPRLQPKSFKSFNSREGGNGKSDLLDQFSADENKSDLPDQFCGDKSDPRDHPSKKTYIKRQQQQKDLFHERVDPQDRVDNQQSQAVSGVVVVLGIESLKEYGIAGEQAARYLKRYTSQYLLEKIEIIEHKRYCGERIRTFGGMLKKAIDEDWQPPEGFSTRAQRDEAARRERETKERETREAAEKAARDKRSRENAEAAEEWKKNAPAEMLKDIHERARQEVLSTYADTDETLLRMPIRLRENKIIAEEYMELVKRE